MTHPARLQDPSHLTQRGTQIGNRAQRPGRKHNIELAGSEGQLFAAGTRVFDRDRHSRDARLRQPHAQLRRLDRPHLRDARRVVAGVQPGPEPDLYDVSVQASADAAARFVRGCRAMTLSWSRAEPDHGKDL